MYIRHLSLTNFRNYARLELEVPSHITVLRGENAQGKSNLLEALYLLAIGRSPRTGAEKELISWPALQDAIPGCRVAADVRRSDNSVSLDVALVAKPPPIYQAGVSRGAGPAAARGLSVEKRLRVNGVARRAFNFVGRLNAVAFSVLDIALIGGEPALRRRYLDATNSQLNPAYLRQLQRYHRVLAQRNRLLRRIRENEARLDELDFWDAELLQSGSYLIVEREQTVSALADLAGSIHDGLSGGEGGLDLAYGRSIDRSGEKGGRTCDEVGGVFSEALRSKRDRELAQAVTLVGPHRDDMAFLVSGTNVGTYGSRGQQRTAALALKLAEAQLMLERTGEHPVLLLDDVLSELDARRRAHLLNCVEGFRQVLITTTDLAHFEVDFLSRAKLFEVAGGRVWPA